MLFGVGGLTYAVLWVRYRPVVGFRVFACVCVTRLKLGILDYPFPLRYGRKLAARRVNFARSNAPLVLVPRRMRKLFLPADVTATALLTLGVSVQNWPLRSRDRVRIRRRLLQGAHARRHAL